MVFSRDKRYHIKRATDDFKSTHNRPYLSDETHSFTTHSVVEGEECILGTEMNRRYRDRQHKFLWG